MAGRDMGEHDARKNEEVTHFEDHGSETRTLARWGTSILTSCRPLSSIAVTHLKQRMASQWAPVPRVSPVQLHSCGPKLKLLRGGISGTHKTRDG